MNIEVTVDGSSRWRKMYAGIIIRNADTREILEQRHVALGRGTNNRAEYLAMIHGCDYASAYPHKSVIFYTDSQLVLRQVKGEYQVKNKDLRVLHRQLVERLKRLKAILRWHRRDEGDGPIADKLASSDYKEILHANHNRVDQGGTGKNDTRKTTPGTLPAGRPGRFHSVENKTAATCRNSS